MTPQNDAHDYKAALDDFTDPDISFEFTCEKWSGVIEEALRIADKLMQGPSEGMIDVGINAFIDQQPTPISGAFKAMRSELIKEVNNESNR